jgi:hypothetical protein
MAMYFPLGTGAADKGDCLTSLWLRRFTISPTQTCRLIAGAFDKQKDGRRPVAPRRQPSHGNPASKAPSETNTARNNRVVGPMGAHRKGGPPVATIGQHAISADGWK